MKVHVFGMEYENFTQEDGMCRDLDLWTDRRMWPMKHDFTVLPVQKQFERLD